jgi:hypothetical protein
MGFGFNGSLKALLIGVGDMPGCNRLTPAIFMIVFC